MTAAEWIDAFADKLGVAPPTEDEFEQLLTLAGIAAHGSERVAAPVSCWVAATAGVPIDTALHAAREVSGDSA